MKKLLAILTTMALLLSLGAIMVAAELPTGIPSYQFARGSYGVENPEDFSPIGTIKIQWDEDASDKLNLADGDMTDWQEAGYNLTIIDQGNLVSWTEDATPDMMNGWKLSAFFVADAEWLYIGFYVNDTDFVRGDGNPERYSGDTFQVCIDFGNMLGDAVKEEPEFFPNPKNIFYSFDCGVNDGDPIRILREESADDRWLTESAGDGVRGSTAASPSGWVAEFALSWELLHKDYEAKAWVEDTSYYVGGIENKPLQIGGCMYYLNGGDAFWAAATTNGITDDGGTPCVSWTCYDNGFNLELDITDDVKFEHKGIVILSSGETQPPSPEVEDPTEAPVEDPTEAPADTVADATTNAPAGDVTNKPSVETNSASKGDAGCTSIISVSAVAVWVAVAAAVALKKKD